MENTLKTILQGVRLAIDKAVAKIPKKLSDLEIDMELGVESTFIVNITENEDRTFSADKTFAEIEEAFNKGLAVECNYNNVLYQPNSYYPSVSCIFVNSGVNGHKLLTFFVNGKIRYTEIIYQVKSDSTLNTTDKTIVGAINEVNDSALKSPSTGEIGQMLAPVSRDFDGTITDWNLIKVLGNSKDDQDNCALRITSQNINTNSGNIIHYTIKDMTGYIVCEFDSYQGVQGNFVDLNTTDKTIVGAINELKAEIEALKGN